MYIGLNLCQIQVFIMENDTFIDQFITNEKDCNEDVLCYIINAMDDRCVAE